VPGGKGGTCERSRVRAGQKKFENSEKRPQKRRKKIKESWPVRKGMYVAITRTTKEKNKHSAAAGEETGKERVRVCRLRFSRGSPGEMMLGKANVL